jgi:heat-inducible transcriptional repressor
MSRLPTLASRTAEILHSIVQTYIDTGEPVASRTISRRRRDGLSPATIRNIMADLCDQGFLEQPHTSAGRVPTEKAFRNFVQSLHVTRLLSAEIERLQNELTQTGTVEQRVERSSRMLTELTSAVGIAAAIPAAAQSLDHIELILLSERRVLMIVITSDRIVRDRVVLVDGSIDQDELNSIRNYINHHFSGWSLSGIHRELQQRLERGSAAYDSILKKLMLLYDKGLLDIGLTPELHMEGAANLIGFDFHLTREKMRELMRALEEKKRILQLLDRFLEQPPGQVDVHVGLADSHPSMRELSIIGVTIALPGGLSAKIAVLGPIRMDYERAMSAVMHVGRAFGNFDS